MYGHLDKEGPVPADNVSEPSAEYKSEYDDDDSQYDITTEEIKQWFPDLYQHIENWDDSLERIKIVQMIKLQINNQFRKDLNQEAKQNTDKNQSNVQKELNISELDYDDDGENPHIKVYKNQEEKQFSITTPRQEMMNSIEKVRTTEECEKTIKGNTIEEDNLRHDTFLESSSNSMYFTSKESASHEVHRIWRGL